MTYLYDTIIFFPLYNGFVYLFGLFPWADAGLIVILFTCIVRLILFPLSRKAVITQLNMKNIEPELKALKEKYKTDPQTQAKEVMKLYKDRKINPFASFFLILIQLPIIYGLYSIFVRSGLPQVNTSWLYSFVHIPNIDMHLFGLINISAKSWILSLFAAGTQFFQIKYSTGNIKKTEPGASFQDDLARNMQVQMKYIFPVMVFFISYSISGAIALYWTVSNLFTLVQEIVVRKQLANKKNQ